MRVFDEELLHTPLDLPLKGEEPSPVREGNCG